MKIDQLYMEQARRLHQSCPVVDAHLDLAGELLLRVKNAERDVLRSYYLEDLRAAGINLVVSSVYMDREVLPEQGLRTALDQIGVLLEEIYKNKEFLLVKTSKDLEKALRENRIGILIFLEGMDFIGTDLWLLPALWELGVRGASLTWSRRNALADGCCKASELKEIRGGLSEDGIAAVKKMEELGMMIDISHLNDDGIEDIFRITQKPVLATHSNSRSVCFHYRNLRDDQLRELGNRGGLAGLNGCDFLVGCSSQEDSLSWLCRHLEYEAGLIGADHLGFGFDFCDSYDRAVPKPSGQTAGRLHDVLGNHRRVPELTAALLQRGMEESEVKKIMGGNFIEFFRKMLPTEGEVPKMA